MDQVQDRIGAGYVPDGNPVAWKGLRCSPTTTQQRWTGRRMVLVRGRDSVDRIPSDGQRDLDQGWVPLQADDYFLTAHTKHGGVASLTRAEYDRLARYVHMF